jgi:hypothetical protein
MRRDEMPSALPQASLPAPGESLNGCTKASERSFEYLKILWRNHSPPRQGDDPPTVPLDELRVMGCNDHGGPLGVQQHQHVDDVGCQLRVEISCGFIGQDDGWVFHQGSSDGDSLLLAARDSQGIFIHPFMEPDEPKGLPGPPSHLLLAVSQNLEGKSDILKDRSVVEELEVLENHADPSPQQGDPAAPDSRYIHPVDQNLPARWFLLAENQLEERALSRTTRPGQENKLSPLHSDADIRERVAAARVSLMDVVGLNHVLLRIGNEANTFANHWQGARLLVQ